MASTHGVAPAPPSEGAPPLMLRSRRAAPPPAPPRPPGRAPHRSKRTLVGLNILVGVLLIAVASVYGYVSYRDNQIHRRAVAGLLGSASGQPQTILIVGSDSRANIKGKKDLSSFGDAQLTAGQRSDTIMLLHLDPRAKTASLLSIPRDLWVQIPGTDRHDRINSTFNSGPDLLVRTIRDAFGIEVSHYVEVDFNSFRGIVNAVGAVHVYFPTAARDIKTGLNITRPGCYGLDGQMSLEFVRSRYYEYYQNGSWHPEGASDLARIKRQQDFIKKVMSKAINVGLNNPVKLNGVVGSLASNLVVDSNFHLSDMVKLAGRYRSFTPDQLQSETVPTTREFIGGADVQVLQQPEAGQKLNAFLGLAAPATGSNGVSTTGAPATTAPVSPADVRVQVLNGSGVNGQAGAVATSLRDGGFVVISSGSASSYNYPTTVIQYPPGQKSKAEFIKAMIVGGAEIQPVSAIQGADLVLVTGRSYGGLRARGAGVTPPSTPLTGTAGITPTTAPFLLPGAPTDATPPPCPG